jgi:hypothetical protein
LESIIRRLRIQSLRAQFEASRLYCASLTSQFETAVFGTEKAGIARRYDRALKQTHRLQLSLELLERQEREEGNPLKR